MSIGGTGVMCVRCRKEIQKQQNHAKRMEQFCRGFEVLEQGGSYSAAAEAAGYADAFQFSRSVYNAFGERPSAIVERGEWRVALLEDAGQSSLFAR